MAKPEWGVKRTCLSCGARFYDLQRQPITCPKCGAELDLSALAKPRRIKADKETAAPAAAAGTSLVEEEGIEVEDDADESLEDTSASSTSGSAGTEDDDTDLKGTSPDVDEDDDADLGDFDDDALIENDDDDTGLDEVARPSDEDDTT